MPRSPSDSPFDVLTEGVDGETLRSLQELYDRDLIDRANACEDQRGAIGAYNRTFHRALQGDLGLRPTLSVHAMDYFAQRFHGHDWRDPELQAWFAKRHDYARIEAVSGKIQVGYGSKSAGAAKRFSKSYGVW